MFHRIYAKMCLSHLFPHLGLQFHRYQMSYNHPKHRSQSPARISLCAFTLVYRLPIRRALMKLVHDESPIPIDTKREIFFLAKGPLYGRGLLGKTNPRAHSYKHHPKTHGAVGIDKTTYLGLMDWRCFIRTGMGLSSHVHHSRQYPTICLINVDLIDYMLHTLQ